jgi:L-lactate dehydrogenase complex protein LldE
MGCLKLEHLTESNPDFIVSGDMSCLMHMGGLAQRAGKPIKTLHIVQILQAALQNHA